MNMMHVANSRDLNFLNKYVCVYTLLLVLLRAGIFKVNFDYFLLETV